jgi:hypothetical protein
MHPPTGYSILPLLLVLLLVAGGVFAILFKYLFDRWLPRAVYIILAVAHFAYVFFLLVATNHQRPRDVYTIVTILVVLLISAQLTFAAKYRPPQSKLTQRV